MSGAKSLLLLFTLLIGFGAFTGCSTQDASHLPLMPLDQMPAEIQSAPSVVQTAYRFAAANPELMQQIPCYCGCGSIGHTSNYACYIAGKDANGALIFDAHALGCSICVDITLDAMRLQEQGKSPQEIKAYIDRIYSKFGPSNMP
ncbi:MAG: PCYCGC motif-containing (lipo)protein [Anaerolineales bacterium]